MKAFKLFIRGMFIVALCTAILTCPFIATALTVISVCGLVAMPVYIVALPYVILFLALGLLLLLYIGTL